MSASAPEETLQTTDEYLAPKDSLGKRALRLGGTVLRVLGIGFMAGGAIGAIVGGAPTAAWGLIEYSVATAGGPLPNAEDLGITSAPHWLQGPLELMFASSSAGEAAAKFIGGIMAMGVGALILDTATEL